jgi:ankyrin repeat protein
LVRSLEHDRMSEQAFLSAIDDDDRATVQRLLRDKPSLATSQIPRPKLYTKKISHWIYRGDTPLHLAAAGYRVEIVKLLLAAGADVNARLNHRRSGPLHYAADTCFTSAAWDAGKQVETLRLLLKAGAEINAPDKNGATPLHRAVRTRGAEAVKCLIERGADPMRQNKPGSTPFHLAVQTTGRGGSGSEQAKTAQAQIIEILLRHGMNPALKDARGKTVLESAQSDWIRQLLVE